MVVVYIWIFWWDYITTTKKVKSWAPIGFLFLSLTLSPYISHSLRLMFGKKIFDGIHPPDQPSPLQNLELWIIIIEMSKMGIYMGQKRRTILFDK